MAEHAASTSTGTGGGGGRGLGGGSGGFAKCQMCLEDEATVQCENCKLSKCPGCDSIFHKGAERKTHTRYSLLPLQRTTATSTTPTTPHVNTPPVATPGIFKGFNSNSPSPSPYNLHLLPSDGPESIVPPVPTPSPRTKPAETPHTTPTSAYAQPGGVNYYTPHSSAVNLHATHTANPSPGMPSAHNAFNMYQLQNIPPLNAQASQPAPGYANQQSSPDRNAGSATQSHPQQQNMPAHLYHQFQIAQTSPEGTSSPNANQEPGYNAHYHMYSHHHHMPHGYRAYGPGHNPMLPPGQQFPFYGPGQGSVSGQEPSAGMGYPPIATGQVPGGGGTKHIDHESGQSNLSGQSANLVNYPGHGQISGSPYYQYPPMHGQMPHPGVYPYGYPPYGQGEPQSFSSTAPPLSMPMSPGPLPPSSYQYPPAHQIHSPPQAQGAGQGHVHAVPLRNVAGASGAEIEPSATTAVSRAMRDVTGSASGSAVVRPKFCPQCGNRLGSGDKFCCQCGYSLSGGSLHVPSTAPASTPPQPQPARDEFYTPPPSPTPTHSGDTPTTGGEVRFTLPPDAPDASKDTRQAIQGSSGDAAKRIVGFVEPQSHAPTPLDERASGEDTAMELMVVGMQTCSAIKEALRLGATESHIRLSLACDNDILSSRQVRDNFQSKVAVVKDISASHFSGQTKENFVVVISDTEAERALSCHPNDLMLAGQYAAAVRKQFIARHEAQFAMEKIHQSLTQNGGNWEDSLRSMQRERLTEDIDFQIWNTDEEENTFETQTMQGSFYMEQENSRTDDQIEALVRGKYCKGLEWEDKLRFYRIIMSEKKLLNAQAMIFASRLAAQPDISYQRLLLATRNAHMNFDAYIKECTVCMDSVPIDLIVRLPSCQQDCVVCARCMKGHLSTQLKELTKSVTQIRCPSCDNLIYWEDQSFFTTILKNLLDGDLYEMYEKKILECKLIEDRRFRWCAHCTNGFLWENQNLKMNCTGCQASSCFECGRKWVEQHAGITCEEFGRWELENNPEYQNNQLDGFLRAIDAMRCPKCTFRYELIRGGCLHFHCHQCPDGVTEFCGFCYAIFSHACRRFPGCEQKGLHAHHPRFCLYYLRDNSVQELQKILAEGDTEFLIELPDNSQQQQPQQAEGQGQGVQCPIRVTKELGEPEEPCGKPVLHGQMGSCDEHYKEYLVTLIRKHRLDPVVIFTAQECHTTLDREGLAFPPDATLDQLRALLLQHSPLHP